MKLLRYGPSGKEKPGMLDKDGNIRDLSKVVADIGWGEISPAGREADGGKDIGDAGVIVAVGAWLTVSPLANTLGFVPLPSRYWLFLAVMLLGYAILTQGVKTWFIRRFGE